MDQWMHRSILGRARIRTGCSHCAAVGATLNRRQARGALPREDCYDLKIKHARPVKVREYGAHSDHLRPLQRWLHSRIGKNWDLIWSEACRVADQRSLAGWHLRQHIAFLVEIEPLQSQQNGFRGFYVDPCSNRLCYS